MLKSTNLQFHAQIYWGCNWQKSNHKLLLVFQWLLQNGCLPQQTWSLLGWMFVVHQEFFVVCWNGIKLNFKFKEVLSALQNNFCIEPEWTQSDLTNLDFIIFKIFNEKNESLIFSLQNLFRLLTYSFFFSCFCCLPIFHLIYSMSFFRCIIHKNRDPFLKKKLGEYKKWWLIYWSVHFQQ